MNKKGKKSHEAMRIYKAVKRFENVFIRRLLEWRGLNTMSLLVSFTNLYIYQFMSSTQKRGHL